VPDSFPETLIEVEGERGAIVTRIGNVVEVTIDGKMTSFNEDPPVLPWAARPWHVAQESVLATCRHMLEAVKAGRPAAKSAADNLRTFALVEAAYEAAGKVTPAR
jgi:predicted dehydrogenase